MNPTTYKNPLEAQTSLTSAFNPTNEAQRKAIADASALVPTSNAITPSALTPTTPIQPVVAKQTPLPDASLQSQIDIVNQQYATPLPGSEKIGSERDAIGSIINDLYGTSGESATRAQLEADPALQAKRQQVQDLSARAQALQNEQLAIPLQIQQDAQAGGANVTKGGLQPIQTAALRNNAIQSLSVGSLLSAAQGNLSLALNQVDRAVKAQFEPLKAELEARRANLELLMSDPNIARETSRRAEIAKLQLNFQQSQMEKAEADKKSTLDLAAKLGSFGVDNNILSQIQDAKTFDEAMRIAAPHLQSPESKLALENARLENDARKADIAYKKKQTELLGTPTSAKQEKIEQAKKNAAVAVEVANDQVATIDGLLGDDAMQYAVGPTETDRGGQFIGIPYVGGVGRSLPALVNTGKTQNFIASVDQLVSQGTLDTLLNLKKSGGTLGALSDQERIMLRSAFSKIGQWEITDDKTKKVTGYAVDEDSFKRELLTIQALARKAGAEAAGGALDTASSEEIDRMLGVDTISDDDLAAYLQ